MRHLAPLLVTACSLVAGPVLASPPSVAHAVEAASRLAKHGELVAARDALTDVVYDTPVPGEPAAVGSARAEARRLFDDLDRRIPRVHIVVPPEPAPVRLSVDGVILPVGAERLPLPVDPGHHVVIATCAGLGQRSFAFDVPEAGEASVAMRFDAPAVVAPPAAPAPAPAPALAPQAALPSLPEAAAPAVAVRAEAVPPIAAPVPVAEAPSSVWSPARIGFQADTRLSVQAPSGSLANGTPLSSILGVRGYWAFDVGWKVNQWLFLGGYLGGSMGGPGGSMSKACQAANEATQNDTGDSSASACTTLGVDVGVLAMASLNPTGSIDPWVGVGLGVEHQTYQYAGSNGQLDGVELPMLLGGVQWRVRDVTHRSILGIGPYFGATVQKYSSASVATLAGSSDVTPGTHTWIHIGVRMTVLP